MRPVNLLPEEHRPRKAGGGMAGSAYGVCALLGALLIGLALFVLTNNSTNEKKSQTAQATRDAQAAEARLASLGRFGDFSTVAKTRRASVEQLAQGRFDWERFLRESGSVLPDGVWLTNVEATAATDPAAAAAAAAGTPAADDATPGAKLDGCAKHQDDVAKLMVRLRQLHRVSDVTLGESSKSNVSSASSSSSTSATSADGCGKYFTFNVKAVFDLATPEAITPASGAKAVPAKLGGGS